MKKAPPKDPYKIVLLGERGVGKATIIKKFTEGFPQDESVSSLTTQNLRRTIEIPNGPKVTLDLSENEEILGDLILKDLKDGILRQLEIEREKAKKYLKNALDIEE